VRKGEVFYKHTSPLANDLLLFGLFYGVTAELVTKC
jgi:hypothetical protein